MGTPDPSNPVDLAPSAVEQRHDGDLGQFRSELEGLVRCLTCRQATPASALQAEGPARLEGVSDPDDMLMIVRVACPVCGAVGSLTLGYGPIASIEDTDVLRDIRI